METILIDYQIFSWEEQSIIVCTQRCVIYLFRKDFVKTKLYMHVFVHENMALNKFSTG